MTRNPLDVALLAYDGLCTFEFGIMVELFGLPRPEFDPWYRLVVVAVDEGPLRAAGGLTVEAPGGIERLDSAGTIIVPGWRGLDAPVPARLIEALQQAESEGARILSVCSGVSVLAAAGLLDGRRATTHWRYAEGIEARYPAIEIDPDVLYVDEGSIITSAGSAAGIDMGLHLIRRDFGAATANSVARRLVVPPQRDGGQKQFVDLPMGRAEDEDSIARVLDLVREDLGGAHSVRGMAAMAGMSERTFARRFKDATGTTPHRWLQVERVRRGQTLLETTTMSLDRIARESGFSSAQLLRLHFKRVVGTPPASYRRMFPATRP